MAKVTWKDKRNFIDDDTIPREEKITAEDMNELKGAINSMEGGIINDANCESETDALSALATKIAIERRAFRPDLLINRDFQIWQRGTSFPNAKSGEITADHWKTFIENNTSSDSVDIRKSSGRMLITGSNKRYVVYQYVELTDQIKTMIRIYKYLTASAMFICNADMQIGMSVVLFKSSDGTQTNIGTITENITSGKTKIIKFKCDVSGIDLSDYDLIQFNLCDVPAVHAQNNVYIYWAKLEYGEVFTPYIPRPYTEELMLCKRYYQVVNAQSSVAFTNADGKQLIMPISSIPMYKTPTVSGVTLPLTITVRYDGKDANFTATNIIATYYGDDMKISFRGESTSLIKVVCYIVTGISVALNAEVN